ncbi:hypothetical protein BGX26_002111 [Mortierella sp. AD094]|nr:hypothetical protein BGX26_002111 [Mortierella sp. AD094]
MAARFLDMALDDVAKSRAANNRSPNPRRGGGRGAGPSGRDSPSRSNRSSPYSRNTTEDRWTHDKFDESSQRGTGGARGNDNQRSQGAEGNAKITVENLHYAVTLEDIKKLNDSPKAESKLPAASAQIYVEMDQLISTGDGGDPYALEHFAEVKYDPSGRSTGVATILFKDPADAATAIKKLNGITLDGQPMKITYAPLPANSNRGQDRRPGPPGSGPKRDVFSRLGSSEADIASRLGKLNPVPKPTGGRNPAPSNQGRRQQGGSSGGGSSKPAPREKKKPQVKTAEELDAEMDTYMGDATA